MVTQAIGTGARPPPKPRGKRFLSNMAYIVGLGCCMNDRHSKPITTASDTRTPVEEIKTGDTNWSTSTLGMETDLPLRPEAIRSDSSMPDASEIPLSSFEFYPPTPTPPPPAARPQSRPRRERKRCTESPVVTITDSDIATGTTPSTEECQRERSERKAKKNKKSDGEKGSTVQAWSQVDPLYGMYQQERERRSRRQTQGQSRQAYSDIRAFDFMSYGAWIVI